MSVKINPKSSQISLGRGPICHLVLEISGGLKAHFKCLLSWYFIALPQEKQPISCPSQLSFLVRRATLKHTYLEKCPGSRTPWPFVLDKSFSSSHVSEGHLDSQPYIALLQRIMGNMNAVSTFLLPENQPRAICGRLGSRRPHRVRHTFFQKKQTWQSILRS